MRTARTSSTIAAYADGRAAQVKGWEDASLAAGPRRRL